MKAPRNILVPVDFSDAGTLALDAATTLARHFDAALTLLHVTYVPPHYAYAQGLTWPVDDIQREAKKELDRTAARVSERVGKVEAVLVAGDPSHEIVALTRGGDVDMVVMGTHGRRGLSRWMLGSVAERVVRLSPVPVLTVPVASPHFETPA